MLAYLSLFKALHIIGWVAWFAGLFYLVRLFVYHREAFDKPVEESKILIRQYIIMENRLYKIITRPAMIFTWLSGITMLVIQPDYLKLDWMLTKLVLLILLSAYHDQLPRIMRKLAAGEKVMNSFRFRLFNELPTLFLIAIVLLAVYKDLLQVIWVFLIIVALAVLLFLSAHFYKKRREGKK